MVICRQYSLEYSYVIEEPAETDHIVIRRVTQMLGIRRITVCKKIKREII